MSVEDLNALVSELTSGDDARAEKAAIKIACQADHALPLLEELLRSPNPDYRWWATRALGAINQKRVTPLLLKSLRDQDTAVQHCAAIALREQPDLTAIPALISLLGNQDTMLARLAADALAEIGNAATPALIAVTENGSQEEVINAVRALSKIGDYRAIPALFKALDHESIIVQHLADKGLENMGVGMSFYKPD